ncbi:Rho GTPase-activating protein 39 [Psilocybe cubensis]|uniref:Rho GTPase-activating protein 39 n=2 Tax=Psilocybe cubensis TaxID=181762 RepID=A0A8H7Y4R4_PSICU|nr:Rho GTPase-activating protein 39 [Psilocybe cubensis]KAH9485197.1 Rho GTPase-activating protein 39 [Psilocybe cubensis]
MSLAVAAPVSAQKHDTPPQTPPSSATKLVNPGLSRQPSASSNKSKKITTQSSRQSTVKTPTRATFTAQDGDDATWGSNFWVTLVDPQTSTSFFACPATGQVSWDPPVGTFVLPPSADGEWWELTDESRGGLPYYYQTKTGETVWERPSGFVIPLGILQNTAVGRRLSQTTFDHFSKLIPISNNKDASQDNSKSPTKSSSHPGGNVVKSAIRKSSSGDHASNHYSSTSKRHNVISVQLTPIPGSPNATDESCSPSLASKKSILSQNDDDIGKLTVPKLNDSPGRRSQSNNEHSRSPDSSARTRSKGYTSHRSPPPQSLHAALEILTTPSNSENGAQDGSTNAASSVHGYGSSSDEVPSTPSKRHNRDIPPSPSRPIPGTPKYQPTVGGKGISSPILNHAATMQMSPEHPWQHYNLGTTFPILPHALASDIQQFSESDYAKQYFSTHRTGFIFKRRVPVAQLMTYQKLPLTSPLLVLNRALSKDAVKMFKVIQHIMGDREREKPINVRYNSENQTSLANTINNSTTSLSTHTVSILEEERWLISEGLKHGELRDEIYCQLMKQLTGNPIKESIFKGWQLLCVLVISFPPSKNFEAYLQAFIQKHTTQQEGRVDVMAKHCLRRLASISKKGPRGKPPSIAEIETASDAAFNPSTFGESLDATIRLQERNYPHQKIPIILPFLADGILALGGTKSEGIFRVPGDNDSVSALKLRIDRGYYTLEGVDDPHVLASLMKLWLRELCDPLVPDELYNECIQNSKDPEACVQIVERLPTINRRVVLFVISFLQIFLEERTQSVTKMTPANLALVMAPNLLRCNSESMSVVFTNAQYEQIFVYNLLLHLRCDELDSQYKPVHGLGAVANVSSPKKSRNRSRRPEQ